MDEKWVKQYYKAKKPIYWVDSREIGSNIVPFKNKNLALKLAKTYKKGKVYKETKVDNKNYKKETIFENKDKFV